MNKRYVGSINVEDYLVHTLWAFRLTFDHRDINAGVITYHNGYERKSLAAVVMKTSKGEKVSYRDKNNFNCQRSNLFIRGTTDWMQTTMVMA